MKFFRRLPYYVRILAIATVVAFCVVAMGIFTMQFSSSNPSVKANTSPQRASIISKQVNIGSPVLSTTTTATDSDSGEVTKNIAIAPQKLLDNRVSFGHLPYAQSEPNLMMLIGSYATGGEQRFEFLHPEAGKALMKMIYAAREEGVWIVPVSGFRTLEQQQKLFQDQIKRRGSPQEAAKVSAPPGHSEHHTGFAVDLADGKFPKQDVTYVFEQTDTYRWLTRRAREFGFEMSFTANNSQGVSFEPWHWRYVASPDAAAIFANTRKLH